MRLTRIEIEKFKGIGVRQQIDLKPITLLFGPNSAGKSTILQALHYLREILERGNIDPDRTIAGGLIDLGGFATLVHNHELDRTVVLKVVLDLSGGQGAEGLPLNLGLSFDEPDFAELPIRYMVGDREEYCDYAIVQEVGLEVNIRWSALVKSPYVSRFAIEMDGESLAAIVSPPSEGRAQLTEFNLKHPLLQKVNHLDDFITEDEAEEMSLDLNREFGIEENYSYVLFDAIWELSREVAVDRATPNTPDDQLRIAVATEIGALPKLDHDLDLEIRDPDVKNAELEERTPRINGLRALISEFVLGPARLVRDHLMQMTYIGPLRDIPTRNFRPQVTPDEARWAQGLAAWDLLYNDRCENLMDKVNVWLSGEERLKTMYRLERIEFKEIQVPGAMHQMFERGVNEDDIGELQELYLSLATRTEIALRDVEKGILVSPGDVGVGISQMVPVIVASLHNQDGVLGIEQPEIHVHPAIQVGMGDLFINAATADQDKLASGKTLIIETHSEHIMLRLLRRMREQTEGELPPDVLGLTSDDLSVIYAEASVEGIRFRPLRVSPDGDFVDRWPNGFFCRAGRGTVLMLSEYAVEPEAIGADWRTFKDLIDRFGADKGRLISRLPPKWEKKVIQAARDAGVPDIRMAAIVERLRNSKHKVVDFIRSYDHDADWIDNALREHATRPFKAIICEAEKADCAEAMVPDDCTDMHPRFVAPTSCDVTRTEDQIADALHTITAMSKEVDIVDPYFDLRPAKGKYLATLASLLARLTREPGQAKAIRIHFRSHDTRPPADILARGASG